MINQSWDPFLNEEFQKPYFVEMLDKVDEEYKKYKIYPPREKIFSAARSSLAWTTKIKQAGNKRLTFICFCFIFIM